MNRIRILYAKTEALRYTGNLDMQKVWERTLRRAHLPIAYSQGFHPQARIQQACPLPLGLLSRHEVLDFWLECDAAPEEVRAALEPALPPGITLQKVEIVPLNAPALQTQGESALYHILLLDPISPEDLLRRCQDCLAATSLPRQRRDKQYDLRPLILELFPLPESTAQSPLLHLRLTAREAATGRPDEVLLALGLDPSAARIERIELRFREEIQ
jgi:radical SAM-linked protein